ncbi:hypothetical protein [Nostoc sp.]|uniref:hypothetical protein n=1 Tax=Nostoc sp. TaxID=1180 RepID=UPI002FFB8307
MTAALAFKASTIDAICVTHQKFHECDRSTTIHLRFDILNRRFGEAKLWGHTSSETP